MKYIAGALVAACGLVCSGLTAAAQETYSYSLVQNDEEIGYLKVIEDGASTSVEYYMDDNGRGPKHTEQIIMGPHNVPLEWSIVGKSLMGGDVEESFKLSDGVATWNSQADQGHADVQGGVLYAVNDGSPWANYIYANALLADADHRLPVIPTGEMKLEKVKDVTLAAGGKKAALSVYRLSGIDLAPTLIALDEEGKFFSQFSEASVVVKDGYVALANSLMELARELQTQRYKDLAQQLRHTYDAPYAIVNVHILDPRTAGISAPSTILVKDERIEAIEPYRPGKTYPDDVTVFNGAGGTIMPGMWDMHSHASLSSGLYYIAAGVTSTRDMGNNNEFLQQLMKDLDDGTLIGPRITPAGFIEGRSPYSARYGIVVASEQEALDAVDWYAERGYTFIKIYNSMNPAWVPAMAKKAHGRGMRVIGHVPAFTNANAMIRAGYDEITHINQLMLGWLLTPDEDTRTPLRLTGMARAAGLDLDSDKVQETLTLMQENNVGIDPTAVILERLMMSRAGETPPGDVDYLDHMPISYQRYRKRTFVTLEDEAADKAYRDSFQVLMDTLQRMYDAGIVILPGTDDGTGFTVHRELELYRIAGIPAEDVLRIGVLQPAEYLGYGDDLGTIEAGKYADFVLLPSNPLETFNVIKTPRMVVKNGDVYFPEEIYQALSIEPFASKPDEIKGASH